MAARWAAWSPCLSRSWRPELRRRGSGGLGHASPCSPPQRRTHPPKASWDPWQSPVQCLAEGGAFPTSRVPAADGSARTSLTRSSFVRACTTPANSFNKGRRSPRLTTRPSMCTTRRDGRGRTLERAAQASEGRVKGAHGGCEQRQKNEGRRSSTLAAASACSQEQPASATEVSTPHLAEQQARARLAR